MKPPYSYTQMLAVPLLLATMILLQFTSTALVSDLSLSVLPGMPLTFVERRIARGV
jgi:hypothetical protein